MNLNSLKPPRGAKRPPKRVGRGIGSGVGKTCGRGHKGQKSRSSAGPRAGFEGGQMPLQRRLPKFGFSSRKARYRAEIRVDLLARFEAEVIDLATLRAAGLIGHHIVEVKVIASGRLDKPVRLAGIRVTSGARAIIEGAGGKVE